MRRLGQSVVGFLVFLMAVGIRSIVATGSTESLGGGNINYPGPNLIESTMRTTVSSDFAGNHAAFVSAQNWQRVRLLDDDQPAPYLACGKYGHARTARENLERSFSASSVYIASHNEDQGVCFLVTARPSEAEELLNEPSVYGIISAGPFLSTLKITPGLLDHGAVTETIDESLPIRLKTTHGDKVNREKVRGLSIRLSPGAMKVHDDSSSELLRDWRHGFKSRSVDMRSSSFWSDTGMHVETYEHLSHPMGAMLAKEWTRAAEMVQDRMGKDAVGKTCGWDKAYIHPVDDDFVVITVGDTLGSLRQEKYSCLQDNVPTGIDHLLPNEDGSEMQMACFMGLLSHLASKAEVLRISPLPVEQLHNAVGSAIVQSASIIDTPFLDVGLDGTGEVIQIIDTGLDETSCFFADEDGLEIEHGSYFDGLMEEDGDVVPVPSHSDSYYYDLTRRKIVQYIELFNRADLGASTGDDDSFYYFSEVYPTSSSTVGYDQDVSDGHGTHTAGTAAGAQIFDVTASCSADEMLGCVGECVTAEDAADDSTNGVFNIDTYCPYFDCDGNGQTSPNCLSDNVTQNLNDGGGIARGAKLAIFDVRHNGDSMATLAGNGLFNVTSDTGAKLHSNSWGYVDSWCDYSELDLQFDTFMYENPDNLILISAGNDGGWKDSGVECTVTAPAIGKNTLTVGATSTGPTRSPSTGEDGRLRYEQKGWTDYDEDGMPYFESNPEEGLPSESSIGADIDTVAYFSSFGPTDDGRIKPEVVAPGDRVFSASSDGSDEGTCQLEDKRGTSMACPLVAGSAALVRQYFANETFYADDVATRGFCGNSSAFLCSPFAPSAATVKAMLINSANLMGGDAQPDSIRGFGRIHLGAGMPMGGAGNLTLFVDDSSTAAVDEYGTNNYTFHVDGAAGEDFRATLSWIDPPSTAYSETQLIHDLDLAVTAPDGTVHYMWSSGPSTVNVNERVIVPAVDVTSGYYTVEVSAKALVTTMSQTYSLVVTGACVP